MDRKKKILLSLGMVSLAGLLLGTALPELFRMGTGTYAGFFSLYSFQKFEHTVVSSWKLFLYLAAGRLQTFLFLWMSVFTPAGIWFHLGYVFWLAVSGGMLVSLLILRDGYEGILLFFCCIFPQWLLYAAVWKREVLFLIRQAERRRWQEGASFPALPGGLPAELARMLGFCLAGCAAEAYLGQWTLKIFLQLN